MPCSKSNRDTVFVTPQLRDCFNEYSLGDSVLYIRQEFIKKCSRFHCTKKCSLMHVTDAHNHLTTYGWSNCEN